MNADYQHEADLFFKMIADHGRFNEAQLWRFVELKLGLTLKPAERVQLISYALVLGATREKGLYPVYQMPRTRKRRTRKGDVVTIDMWKKEKTA